ncbi:MAG: hypothetical protein II920_07510 [Clostridia bacterium]|nr:hypothetical protein [Clostridia bacterium]
MRLKDDKATIQLSSDHKTVHVISDDRAWLKGLRKAQAAHPNEVQLVKQDSTGTEYAVSMPLLFRECVRFPAGSSMTEAAKADLLDRLDGKLAAEYLTGLFGI